MNIIFIISLITIILLCVYYTVSKKIRELKSYDFDIFEHQNEDNITPYYSISYKNMNGKWIDGSELILKYKQFLNDYQKELLAVKVNKEKQAKNYLTDFKNSIEKLSSKNVMFNFKFFQANK